MKKISLLLLSILSSVCSVSHPLGHDLVPGPAHSRLILLLVQCRNSVGFPDAPRVFTTSGNHILYSDDSGYRTFEHLGAGDLDFVYQVSNAANFGVLGWWIARVTARVRGVL